MDTISKPKGNVGIEPITLEPEAVIFPNPVISSFFVQKNVIPCSVEVYDFSGILTLKQELTSSYDGIDLVNKPQGIYFITIKKGNQVFRNKIIKL